jgi:hypothetical protein
MVIIKVWCLPTTHAGEAHELYQELIATSLKIEGLGLDKNRVVCLFPIDPMPAEVEEVIIEVSFLDTTRRSQAACEELAKEISALVATKFPRARVECFVDPLRYQGNISRRGP